MPTEKPSACAICGAETTADVPEYFIELECFRLMEERTGKVPRRGSKDYHEAIERLLPEIRESYFRNRRMYDGGHLWCPLCGCRLTETREIGEI